MRSAPLINKKQFVSILKQFSDISSLPHRAILDLQEVDFGKDNQGALFPNCFGLKELRNGMYAYFASACDAGEIPVVFMLYWDGKSIRGYIPKNGNTFNSKHMIAYGREFIHGIEPTNEDLFFMEPSFLKMEEEIISTFRVYET